LGGWVRGRGTWRELRQCGPHAGPATLGICVWNEGVAEAATRIMRELGYGGVVDMDFRYDERDRQYKLLDVNPRLGGSFRLFVAENGLNVVRAAYLDLTGQPVPPSRARDGRKWFLEPHDVVVAAQMAAEGRTEPAGVGTLAVRSR
jgi:D-aspartate ligase